MRTEHYKGHVLTNVGISWYVDGNGWFPSRRAARAAVSAMVLAGVQTLMPR